MWTVRIVGDEETDLLPYEVFNAETKEVFDRSSHRAVAENIAFRLNTSSIPTDPYEVTEADEVFYISDQLEAIADLERMKTLQKAYPDAYQNAWADLLNSPIENAERAYASGWKTLQRVMTTCCRPIWRRETPPESMDESHWRTLAAIDRLYEYELMSALS